MVSLPRKLKTLLERDHRLIESEMRLPQLPSVPSVSAIIGEFVTNAQDFDVADSKISHTKGRARYWKSLVDECSKSFQDFFDLAIFSDILYKNEKLRHRDLCEGKNSIIRPPSMDSVLSDDCVGLRPSEYYGFIHLLRLVSKFDHSIKLMPCDGDTQEVLSMFARHLVAYLNNNVDQLYNCNRDYELMSDNYRQRLTRSSR